MAYALKIRSGTTELHNAFIGLQGELTYNTETDVLHAHDARKTGGHPIARSDLSNLNVKDADGNALALTNDDIGRDFKLRWNGTGFDIVPLEA